MDIETFWTIIEAAQAQSQPDEPFDQTLAGQLSSRSPQDILQFQVRFDELHAAAYRWDIWAAAYLIGGGCSDDGFLDFRSGLIGQGRSWYEQVTASPDNLAAHPAVAARAPEPAQDEPLFFEGLSSAAVKAFAQVTGGDEDSFYESWKETPDSPRHNDLDPGGEDFNFDDDQQMRRRLPRLAALYLDGRVRSRWPSG